MAASIWVKCKQAALLPVICLLLNSCTDNTADNGIQAETAPAAEQPKFEVLTVEIKDMKFVPDSITVKKGDEVVFVNRDIVTHCVTEEKSKAWTSGMILAGESYIWKATESAAYICAIHKVMKGKIVVQ